MSSYVASGLGALLSASSGFTDSISGHMTGWGEPLVGTPQHCPARLSVLQAQEQAKLLARLRIYQGVALGIPPWMRDAGPAP